jgi:hypothetical protein
MKKPINTEPITIVTARGKREGTEAWIENGKGAAAKMRAKSTGHQSSAAHNLALRYFWGGNTNWFAGTAERDATLVTQLSEWRFRASLRSEEHDR